MGDVLKNTTVKRKQRGAKREEKKNKRIVLASNNSMMIKLVASCVASCCLVLPRVCRLGLLLISSPALENEMQISRSTARGCWSVCSPFRLTRDISGSLITLTHRRLAAPARWMMSPRTLFAAVVVPVRVRVI